MSEVYINESHLLVNDAFEQAFKIKGWDRYEAILYMAQRARMLGVNGENHKNAAINRKLIQSDSVNKTSVVIEEMAAGNFFNIKE